jgi:RHS repeat-associated protein
MHEDLPNNPGVVHHYTAEILSVQEQYAFGMNMPGRSFSVEEYRYGFNGKETQNELMGDDNAQDFGARMYDARVGRWWGMDFMKKYYPSRSPYEAMASNPIFYVDVDGKYFTGNLALLSEVISRLKEVAIKYPNKAQVANEILAAICEMHDDPEIEFHLIDGGRKLLVDGKAEGGVTEFNNKEFRIDVTSNSIYDENGNKKVDQVFNTIHEICHGYQFLKNQNSWLFNGKRNDKDYYIGNEKEAVSWSNTIAFTERERVETNEEYWIDNYKDVPRKKSQYRSELSEQNRKYMEAMKRFISGDPMTPNQINNLVVNVNTLRLLLNSKLNSKPSKKVVERCPAYD